jgi:ABC-type branched-subunit amino acid transport system ATPase component
MGDQFIFELNSVNNGSAGYTLPYPSIGPLKFSNQHSLGILLILMVLGTVWLIHGLMKSASGRKIFAVRSTDVGARSVGITPARVKVQIFAVAALIAGVGGVMVALTTNPIVPGTAPPFTGLVWLAVVVLFGVRRPGGAVLAGLSFMLFPALLLSIATSWSGAPWDWLPSQLRFALGSTYLPTILFGLGAINLAEESDGMLALFHKRRYDRQERKRVAAARAAAETGEVEPESVAFEPDAYETVPSQNGPARDGDGAGEYIPRVVVNGDRADAAPSRSKADSGTPALEIRGVSGGYGVIEVLHNVDLVARPGLITAIVGPNGAGKTTLCGVAAGTVAARTGKVFLDGQDVTSDLPHVRARQGLMLAPSDRAIFPGLSVEENLEVKLRSAAERDLAYDRFPVLGKRRRQHAGLLSGGEQQMLALAPALVSVPRVLIADEPTLGLAPQLCDGVYEAFVELRSRGVALVIVEEKPTNALAVADEVVALTVGSVIWHGRPDEATETYLSQIYLGITLDGPPEDLAASTQGPA